jgi:hypothetical protein
MGDLSGFVTSATMDDSDVISPSRKFFPGHFMIFRNHGNLTHLFKNADNWKSVFEHPRCFCFDEYLFKVGLDTGVTAVEEFTEMRIQSHLKSMQMRKKLLTSLVQRLGGLKKSLSGKRKLQDFNSLLSAGAGKLSIYRTASYLDDVMLLENGRSEAIIRWNKGKLFFGERELLYYHFQLSKTKDRLVFERLSEDEFILKINL